MWEKRWLQIAEQIVLSVVARLVNGQISTHPSAFDAPAASLQSIARSLAERSRIERARLRLECLRIQALMDSQLWHCWPCAKGGPQAFANPIHADLCRSCGVQARPATWHHYVSENNAAAAILMEDEPK